MLTNLIVVITLQYTKVSNCHECILNLYNVICQLYLRKSAGKKNEEVFERKAQLKGNSGQKEPREGKAGGRKEITDLGGEPLWGETWRDDEAKKWWANIFCEGPKDSRDCWPHHLCHNYTVALKAQKQPQTVCKQMDTAVFQ